MSEDNRLIQKWQRKIEIANRHNIFCRCRDCGEEWVTSHEDRDCIKCGGKNLERIACWQFPDD